MVLENTRGLLRRFLILVFVGSSALQGCASKPQIPGHYWSVGLANTEYLPSERLRSSPRLLESEELGKAGPSSNTVAAEVEGAPQRDGAQPTESGGRSGPSIAAGAVAGGVRSIAAGAVAGAVTVPIAFALQGGLLYCLYPPMCLAMAAGVGAVAGGASAAFGVSLWGRAPWTPQFENSNAPPHRPLSQEEESQFAGLFHQNATTTAFQERVSKLIARKPEDHSEYPRLVVRLIAVRPHLDPRGMSFTLTAFAQAFPAEGVEWKPTEHWVHFPWRTSTEWLASDGQVLRGDLDAAIDALSKSVVAVYLPGQTRKP